ncbi:MAG: alpha/beta hydrolase [Synergistaceae bacterium]|nr:alpha/beta hydrolase [Synergistaceae bacterium]
MKICLAFVLLLGLMSCASYAGEWNLDEMIHPELKEGLKKVPYFELTPETLGLLREVLAGNPDLLPKDESVDVRNEYLPSGLRVRVYTPKTGEKELPALLWMHSGGHIAGSPEAEEWLLLRIAKGAGCIIAAPDYRLAPENPCPTDIEDCYEALLWMPENLPILKDRLAVGGCSAGATLAASMAQMSRDKNSPKICYQLLIYPQTDLVNDYPSHHQINDSRVWCRSLHLAALKWYPGDVSSEYVSPALTEDLSGLPPAYVLTGTLDLLRDEAIAYAQRLMQAGVPVELHVMPGIVHACELLFPNAPVCAKIVDEYINALKEALH